MIRDVLLPALLAKFPGRGFRAGAAPTIGVFPAAHRDVGDVTIVDDHHEATVYLGDITHGHFNPYDKAFTDEQVAEEVTCDNHLPLTEDIIRTLNADLASANVEADARQNGLSLTRAEQLH